MKHNPLTNVLRIAKNTAREMAYTGGDFAAWQTAAREKLAALCGLDKMVPCAPNVILGAATKKDGFIRQEFTFESEPGYFVPCVMLSPDDGKAHPLAICLQGHSTGMHISLGEARYPGDEQSIAGGRDFAVQAASRGYSALCIEQRGMGRCGGDENGPHCHEHTMANLLIGRTTIGERVWDVSRAIDAVKTAFPQVDLRDILCLGNSGGGTATFYATILEPRIAQAICSCSICTFDASIMPLYHCTCNFVPQIRRYFDMGDLAGLIAPRPLIVVAGKEDDIFPLPGVREAFATISRLYTAAGVPENCCLVVGDGGHRFYPDVAWPQVR